MYGMTPNVINLDRRLHGQQIWQMGTFWITIRKKGRKERKEIISLSKGRVKKKLWQFTPVYVEICLFENKNNQMNEILAERFINYYLIEI